MRLLSIYVSRNSFLKLDRFFRICLHRPSTSGFHTGDGQKRDRRVLASAKVFVFLTKIHRICAFLRAVLYYCHPPFERAVSTVLSVGWTGKRDRYVI